MFRLLPALAIAVLMTGGQPSASAGQPTSVADPALTPGVTRRDLSPGQIRATRWGHDERAVDAAMKAEVYRRYGFSGPRDPRCTPDERGRTCEVDHRLPRCLGGADDVRNLSPQPYGGPWNAHDKDRVEDWACRSFRAGRLGLVEAQAIFLGDWRPTYVRLFGQPRSVAASCSPVRAPSSSAPPSPSRPSSSCSSSSTSETD